MRDAGYGYYSSNLANYPGLVGLQEAVHSTNYAPVRSKGGLNMLIKRHRELGMGMGATKNVVRIVRALEDAGVHDIGISVHAKGGVSLRLRQGQIAIPVWDKARGVVHMGADTMAGAMHLVPTGSRLKKMDVADAFVHRFLSRMPSTSKKYGGGGSVKLGSGNMIRIKAMDPVRSVDAQVKVLQDLSRTAKTEWMQTLATQNGESQLSKAYYLQNRIQMDLTDMPELQQQAERIGDMVAAYQKGGDPTKKILLNDELERKIHTEILAFKNRLQEVAPDAQLTGIKPEAFLPFLRENKTANRVTMSTLGPQMMASMYEEDEVRKSLHQMVLARVMHQDDIMHDPQVAMGRAVARESLGRRRIVPIVTEHGYMDQMRQMAELRALRQGRAVRPGDMYQLTTRMPLTVGLMDPGQSQMAYKFLRDHIDDSGVLLGSETARTVAGMEYRHQSKVGNVQTFKAIGPMAAHINALSEDSHHHIGLIGSDLAAEGMPVLGTDASRFVGTQGAKSLRMRDRILLGIDQETGRQITMGAGDRLESITRKGDQYHFNIKRARGGSGMGAGLLVDTRRVGVTGFISPEVGVDIAGAAGDFGMKFGSNRAHTYRQYVGHVFTRLERSALDQKMQRNVMRQVGKALGADVNFKQIGSRGRAFVTLAAGMPSIDRLVEAAMSNDSSTLLKDKVVMAALADKSMTEAQRQSVINAFRVESTPMSKVMRSMGHAVSEQQAAELERAGARMYKFEGTPVQSRHVDMPSKQMGRYGMNYTLADLKLFETQMAGTQGHVGRAYRTLHDFLRPDIKTSGVGSDAYRFLGQFYEGIDGAHAGLMKADTYSLQQIAQMKNVPIQSTAQYPGGVIKESEVAGSLISGTGNNLRKGGFYVKLKKGDHMSIALMDRFGAGKGGVAAVRTDTVFIPGMEFFRGSAGLEGFNELIMQGGSRLDGSGGIERKLFGDYMNVVKTLEDYASGSADVTALQEKLNRLYLGMSEAMVGKDSVIKRYFQPDDMIGMTGRTVTSPFFNQKAEVATVGIYRGALKRAAKNGDPRAVQLLKRAKTGKDIYGTVLAYPGTDAAHHAVVRVKLMDKQHIVGSDLAKQVGNEGLENLIFTSPTLRAATERDLDFDWNYFRFITGDEASQAASVVHGETVRRLDPLHAFINAAPGGATLRQQVSGMTQALEEQIGKDISGFSLGELAQREQSLIEGSAVLRQKLSSPLTYSSFVRQQTLAAYIGEDRGADLVMRALGAADNSPTAQAVTGVKEMLADPKFRDTFSNAWTATYYAALKKGAADESIATMVGDVRRLTQVASEGGRAGQRAQGQLAEKMFGIFQRSTPGENILMRVLNQSGLTEGEHYHVGAAGEAAQGAIEQIGGKVYVTQPGRDLLMERYFNPMAEMLGNLQHIEDATKETALWHALRPLAGQTAPDYSRAQETMGVLDLLGRGMKDGASAEHVGDAARDMQAMMDALQDTDPLLHREMMETAAEAGGYQAMADGARAAAGRGKDIFNRIWSSRWGKIGTIGASAVLGLELFGGLVGDDTPPPVMAGNGAPMPPTPALQGVAQKQHPQPYIPPRPARIQRPASMRTHVSATMRDTAPSYGQTRGHNSSFPSHGQIDYPERDRGEVNPWVMRNYMSQRMVSSY